MRAEVRREIARLIGHTRRYCQMAVNKRLSVVGSSLHEYMVLFRLADEDEVPQHEIAFDAAIDPAAASRLVREMAQNGLLTTRVDPKDKRQRFVRITAKGRTLEQTLTPVVDAAIEPYMVGLTRDEEDQFLALLQKAHGAILDRMAQGEYADARAVPEKAPARRASKATVEPAKKRVALRSARSAPAARTRSAATPRARRSGSR